MVRSALLVVRCFAAAGCAALLLGCSPGERDGPRPNVVLVLVDTTRADRLSLYGYPRKTTPNLERLAGSAVVFDTARSQAACTFPSVNSLLTSQRPARFLGQPLGDWSIPEEVASIAEILREHGYATYAVSASSVVRATPSRQNRAGGYGRGFEVFDEKCLGQPGKCVNHRALSLIRGSKEPYFLYLHYMDPHHPYAAPSGFRHYFARPPARGRLVHGGHPSALLKSLYKQGERQDWDAELTYLSDSYDDEIRYFDTVLARLLAEIQEREDHRDTIVVLASDHGEDFLEHEHLMHCRSLYETSLRVPLILWLPGAKGMRIAAPVENLDIVPTLLDYLGIDATPYDLAGRSLRPLIDGDRPATHTSWAAQSELRAVATERHKLIYDLAEKRSRLFDVAADPAERTDLSVTHPQLAEPLERLVLERVEQTESKGDASRPLRLSRDVEKGLRALGYIE